MRKKSTGCSLKTCRRHHFGPGELCGFDLPELERPKMPPERLPCPTCGGPMMHLSEVAWGVYACNRTHGRAASSFRLKGEGRLEPVTFTWSGGWRDSR